MIFLVDTDSKVIFGWSAKCGCSHIKYIFWFLKTGNVNNVIHSHKDHNKLPDDIENYTTIIFSRNPYKRIVSGFLDKYKKNRPYFREKWGNSFLSFSKFIDKLIKYDWGVIDKHHFTPQTTEDFDKKILLSKNIKFYDICNINYKYIEQLYNKNIPECVLNKKYGHERNLNIKINKNYGKYVYDLHIDDYSDYIIEIKYFYNQKIKEKIFNFYINDFIFFKENGINYINTKF